MAYYLVRESDGAGDSGQMSEAISMSKDGHADIDKDSRPQVGKMVRVGSSFARSFSGQDWWMTTAVTEILEDTEKEVRFKTGNSVYIWKKD